MRNKIKAIIVAMAIAIATIGVGTAPMGTPAQAAAPYLCQSWYYGAPINGLYTGVSAKCNGGIYRAMAYCIDMYGAGEGWYYGPWQSSNIVSSKSCPSGWAALHRSVESHSMY